MKTLFFSFVLAASVFCMLPNTASAKEVVCNPKHYCFAPSWGCMPCRYMRAKEVFDVKVKSTSGGVKKTTNKIKQAKRRLQMLMKKLAKQRRSLSMLKRRRAALLRRMKRVARKPSRKVRR